MVPGGHKHLKMGVTMAIQKKIEKKNLPPPEVIPSGYEKYVTFDPKEADELATIANSEGEMAEPSVKHLGYRVLEDGRHERSFFKKIVKKVGIYALFIALLWNGNALAARSDAAFDDNDWQERQVNTSLTEIFARTREGSEIRPVDLQNATASLTLASGDIYAITGDTTITSIANASTYLGREVKLFRPKGSTSSVTIQRGNNINLGGNITLGAGDSVTLQVLTEGNWYLIASGDVT